MDNDISQGDAAEAPEAAALTGAETEGLDAAPPEPASETPEPEPRLGLEQLSRDLPGATPDLTARLSHFASEAFGVSAEELAAIDDPRLVRLLHAAYAGAVSRQAQRLADAQASRPATSLSGRGGGAKDPNRMTTEEWMRHRNAQVRRAL